MIEAAKEISKCNPGGRTSVAYMTWAEKKMRPGSKADDGCHQKMAIETGAVLAPVGEEWWKLRACPSGSGDVCSDGEQPLEGSTLAARTFFLEANSENEQEKES